MTGRLKAWNGSEWVYTSGATGGAGVGISDLPAADALTVADEFLVTQGGVSKVATLAQLRFAIPRTYFGLVKDTPGLVSYWRLGDLSGVAARDEMQRNPGVYVDTPTLGVVGALAGDPDTAVTFDGSTQRATVAGTLATANDLTIAAWLKTTSTSTLVAAGSLTPAMWLGYLNGGGWSFSYGTDTASVVDAAPSGWHFVVGTRSGTTLTAYADGVAGTPVLNVASGAFSTTDFAIGSLGAAVLLPWAGSVDEVAFWNRALSAAEILALYELGL